MSKEAGMSQYTPGPWVVKPGICKHDHPDTSADVVGHDGVFVADYMDCRDPGCGVCHVCQEPHTTANHGCA
jgi:hypothetical protein